MARLANNITEDQLAALAELLGPRAGGAIQGGFPVPAGKAFSPIAATPDEEDRQKYAAAIAPIGAQTMRLPAPSFGGILPKPTPFLAMGTGRARSTGAPLAGLMPTPGQPGGGFGPGFPPPLPGGPSPIPPISQPVPSPIAPTPPFLPTPPLVGPAPRPIEGPQGPRGPEERPPEEPRGSNPPAGAPLPAAPPDFNIKEPLPDFGPVSALGYRGVISQPTKFMAGEQGPEMVDIQPIKDYLAMRRSGRLGAIGTKPNEGFIR